MALVKRRDGWGKTARRNFAPPIKSCAGLQERGRGASSPLGPGPVAAVAAMFVVAAVAVAAVVVTVGADAAVVGAVAVVVAATPAHSRYYQRRVARDRARHCVRMSARPTVPQADIPRAFAPTTPFK